MPKTYKNPPLNEAVCELRFDVRTPFSQEQANSFRERIKGNFPLSKKGRVNSIEFKIEPNKNSGKNESSYKEGFHEFDQYLSVDEKYIVQLDGGRLSIHRIKPYTSWTDFFPLIKEAYEAYLDIFSPDKLLRIGIRYVNEIIIPAEDFSFDNYFNIKASLPSLEDNNKKALFIGAVFDQDDGRDAIKVQFAEKQIGKPADNRAFVLDFDYFLAKQTVELDGIENWLKMAHTNLETVFEGVVGEKTKELFDK